MKLHRKSLQHIGLIFFISTLFLFTFNKPSIVEAACPQGGSHDLFGILKLKKGNGQEEYVSRYDKIELFNSQKSPLCTLTSENDGIFRFQNLPNGTYYINIPPPSGLYSDINMVKVDFTSGNTNKDLGKVYFSSTPPPSSGSGPGQGGPQASAVSYEGCKGYGSKFGNVDVPNPLCIHGTIGGANKIILMGVTILLIGAIVLAFLMLLWGGVAYILSGGNKEKTAAARKRITYAIIGLMLALLSLFIFRVLGNVLGFDIVTQSKAPINWNDAIGEAVKQEQQAMQNACSADAGNFPGFNYKQCLENYCNSKYRDNDRKRTDCIQLTQGVYDTALQRELKDIQDFCSDDTKRRNMTYERCIMIKCDTKYGTSTPNSTACRNFFLN